MIGQALSPLAARYGYWLRLDAEAVLADREEAADDIRALQLIIRLERDRPPVWRRALELAATGCAAVCLDPRAEPGGEWYEAVRAYCLGHIRKVTRRGRGAQWAATADLPGISLIDGDTQVRAMVPGRVAELDKRIAKLQVGGTDVESGPAGELPAGPHVDPDTMLQLWLPEEPPMTLGKAMAQTGHAGMIAAALLSCGDVDTLLRWRDRGLPTLLHGRSPQFADRLAQLGEPEMAWEQHRLLAVRDAGFTEVGPGTVTVIAQAPGR